MSILKALRGRTGTTVEHPRAVKAAIAAPGVVGAAYVWLLLYAILSAPIWVAFIAAGAILTTWVLTTAAVRGRGAALAGDPRRGDIVVGAESVQLNPLGNVRALRARFAFGVVLTLYSGWLLIETPAFGPQTQSDISFASGIAVTALALLAYMSYRRRSREAKQSVVIPSLGFRFALGQAVAAAIAVAGVWQIVETRLFAGPAVRWLTFENGVLMLAIALALLVVHEFSSERVVHVLEVAGWDRGEDEARREPAHA